MSLSVIIPSRNIGNLRPCVAAVRKHEPGAQIIVVWHTRGEYCPAEIEESVSDVRYAKEPWSFAMATNIGIRAAGDGDVILLNDDALLESPGGFTMLQQAAHSRPEYGIIGATTNLTGQPLQMPRGVGLREVPHIAFVCVLIPRRTLCLLAEKANPDPLFTDGLDERYSIGYGSEDADYCIQVRRAGLKVGVHDGCFVDHGSLRSTFRGDPRAAGDITANHKLLLKKWGKIDW